MPVAKPREVAKPTQTGVAKEGQPAAASRGRRLGKGARRDLRWALRQRPGDDVRDITLHGVRIAFHTNAANKDDARDKRRVDQNEAEHAPPHADKPKENSRQRRSRARAEKYYKELRETRAQPTTGAAAAAQVAETADMPPPPPRPPPASGAAPAAHASTQVSPAAKGDRRSTNNDGDVAMNDASGSGSGKGGQHRHRRG